MPFAATKAKRPAGSAASSASGSIADEFRKEGVYFVPARKADRKTGWERMNTLLQAAGQPDKPGLYVSRLCEYWWQTVPVLPRDPRKPDDVDSRSPDHAADATRYGLMAEKWHLEAKPIVGFW
jgi:hypothetical protein